MKIKPLVRLVCLGLGIWLFGCTGGRGGGGGGGGSYPECDPDLMVAAQIVFPHEGEVIDNLSPLIEWAYPGYAVPDDSYPDSHVLCSTEAFNIYLSSGPYFQDELGGQAGGVPGMDSLYTRTWIPGEPLYAGREYRLVIRPVIGGVEGPTSGVRSFFTGPGCEASDLAAPEPLSPPNYWVVDDLDELLLTWWYPDACLPDSYMIELAPLLLFDGSPLNGSTGDASSSWAPSGVLEDCERYFWRVTPLKDGEQGPASQVYSFTVDLTGSCPAAAVGDIHGTVWEEQCYPYAGPDPLPLGCALNEYGLLFPNQSYDPGEPGIEGLVVSLAQGACPSSTVLRDVPTWGIGDYDFYMVGPGTYCVKVDLNYAWNSFILPGTWTIPEEAINLMLAQQTVTVTADEKSVLDFGWWYAYGNGWGEATGSVFGTVWHDLCAYPPGDPVPDPLPDGCVVDAYGNVHADALRQLDEPGIPGVVVDIAPGPCPSAGMATATTDYNGVYHFNNLTPGDYCLRIDPDHGSTNEEILLPGSWTVIPSGHEGMTFRAVTIEYATTLPGQDFGWDYDNLPLAGLHSPGPVFELKINANCRKGPSMEHEVATFGLAGQSFPILGRNEQNNWFLVRFNDLLECWFGRDSGATDADTSRLPVFTGPALLTCADHKDQGSCTADPDCKWVSPFGAVKIWTCQNK